MFVHTIPTSVQCYGAQPPKQLMEILQCEPPVFLSSATFHYQVATLRAQLPIVYVLGLYNYN